jgi:hypothetical protein
VLASALSAAAALAGAPLFASKARLLRERDALIRERDEALRERDRLRALVDAFELFLPALESEGRR